MKNVYIAGKMTGVEKFNYPAFYEAEDRLRKAGYEVQNPARTDDGSTHHPREFYMREAIKMLLECDTIALIPGWEQSQGALLEAGIGIQLGMKFICAKRIQSLDIRANWEAYPPDYMVIVNQATIPHPESQGAISVKPASCLEEAARIVDGPRQEAYGHPAINHQRTADFWTTYKGDTVFTPEDVCMMMVLQKIAREMNSPKDDNVIDGCGYFRNYQMVREYKANTEPQ